MLQLHMLAAHIKSQNQWQSPCEIAGLLCCNEAQSRLELQSADG